MLRIDGEIYRIPVLELSRKAEFLDKYAGRTEDGVLHRELIGVYFNYQMKLGAITDLNEYKRLWEKLTEPTEFHTVTVPDVEGAFTFTAYFSNVQDKLLREYANHNYWTDLTVNFIAREPAKFGGGVS